MFKHKWEAYEINRDATDSNRRVAGGQGQNKVTVLLYFTQTFPNRYAFLYWINKFSALRRSCHAIKTFHNLTCAYGRHFFVINHVVKYFK